VPAAAVQTLESTFHEEILRPSAPPSESGRPEPRFRVVTRKPLPALPSRRPNAVRNALFTAAAPCAFLLVYVMFWTMAIQGGFQRDRIQAEIARLKVEQMDLRAAKTGLTSPNSILVRAGQLGMEPAPKKLFARLPGSTSAKMQE
jgi:hypothetical protein